MANRLLTFTLAVAISAAASADRLIDPVLVQVRQVQQSSISDDQKIQKLKELLADRPPLLLFSLDGIRKGEGVRLGMAMFRDPSTPRSVRLGVGHELVSRFYSDGFAAEFAAYVRSAALDGGEKEFMRNRDAVARTAVGEIAYMAAGFEGMPKPLFDKAADPRLIPILTNCLDAPDDVYPEDQGCIVMGKPGEPSGRNVPRQLIPIALARLSAAGAVPRMAELARKHHDPYLRANCTYAVARLGDAEAVNELADRLGRRPRTEMEALPLLEFGKGLVERGDERGINYLSLANSGDRDAAHPVILLYHIEQRLDPMEQIHTPATVAFYREVLECEPLLDLLRYDPDKLTISDPPGLLGHKTPADLLTQSRPRIVIAYRRITDQIVANKLNDLAPALRKIADTTKDPEIKDLSLQALRQLGT